jgi:hypothetical protein
VLLRFAGGGFDAEMSGDAAENDRMNAAASELKIEFGAVKYAPLPLGDRYIGAERGNLRDEFREIRRQAAGRNRPGCIDGLSQSIGSGEGDVDQGKRSARFDEFAADRHSVVDDKGKRVRSERPSENAFLQIDQNHGGGAGIEGQFHGEIRQLRTGLRIRYGFDKRRWLKSPSPGE